MSPDASDSDLLRHVLTGNMAAFDILIRRYYRPVAGFVFKKVGRSDLVEDLAQETFLEALQAIKSGRGPQHLSSWLFGIAHNRCGKWLRRKRPVLFDPQAAPEKSEALSEQILQEELEEQQHCFNKLDQHLQDLPEETRRLLQLKHRDGKTCEEIAVETGRPVGTIKSLLARTYKALREALAPALGEANP
jgi:RNA polymerase sigma-70 factor (ECF subfamily)